MCAVSQTDSVSFRRSGFPLYDQPGFREVAGDAWRPGGAELTRHALDLCGFAPAAKVADIGCGTGLTVRLLEERGVHGLGMDRVFSERPDISRFVCADVDGLPFRKNCLDGMICECVLSLLAEPERAVQGFCEVVRPGGLLLLTDMYLLDKTSDATEQENGLSEIGVSCLHGAVSRERQEQRLREHFGTLLFFEDHTRSLKELAARLAWYGETAASPCTCHRFGYGLWVVQKESSCTR